ncbi:hypothetical protein BH10PSE11_BH10PSE11_03340 [soil metagenome]
MDRSQAIGNKGHAVIRVALVVSKSTNLRGAILDRMLKRPADLHRWPFASDVASDTVEHVPIVAAWISSKSEKFKFV